MKYFVASIQYSEPIPEGDGVKKVKKKFLVRAESVTEVEVKAQAWFVSNWQDPMVRAVTETPIQDIIEEGDSEAHWNIKLLFEDMETGKWTPHVVAVNGSTIDLAIKRAKAKNPMAEVEAASRLKIEFDSELLA